MVHQATVTAGFVQRTTQTDYIQFVHSDSVCASYVGRQGGQQVIQVAEDFCLSGSIAHEVLHALGMWHEQSRCDRDNYVQIQFANIIPEDTTNFHKECTGSSDRFDYDEYSIMHYDQYAFCIPDCPGPTIVSLRGLGGVMGQRDSLTFADRGTVDWMYPPWVSISSGPWYRCQGQGGTYAWTASGESGYEFTEYMWYRQWEGSNTWEGLDGGANGTLNLTIGSSDPSFTLRVLGHYWVGGSVWVYSSPDDRLIDVVPC